MNLLLNLLKAFCIVVGAHLLLYAGLRLMTYILDCYLNWRSGDSEGVVLLGGMSFGPCSLAYFATVGLLTFGALYLPPKGRMYAAIGALLLILGVLVVCGIYMVICTGKMSND